MRQLEINDESVETVGSYKYLGFTIDNELNWHAHVDVLCNKLNTRLFFLNSFCLDPAGWVSRPPPSRAEWSHPTGPAVF